MEVKIIKSLNVLPKVFLLSDLNKFSTTPNFLDCKKYVSRSGKTAQGCVQYDGVNVTETRGIYYVPIDPAIYLSFRRKTIWNLDDVSTLLQEINPLSKISYTNKVLVKWDNDHISIYDEYHKGQMIEFPEIFVNGNLRVYKIPPPWDGYTKTNENDKEIYRLNDNVLQETNSIHLVSYEIFFEKTILEYMNLRTMPGFGKVVYIKEDTETKIISKKDEKENVLKIHKDSWILFSFN